jgi:hypothetical protein
MPVTPNTASPGTAAASWPLFLPQHLGGSSPLSHSDRFFAIYSGIPAAITQPHPLLSGLQIAVPPDACARLAPALQSIGLVRYGESPPRDSPGPFSKRIRSLAIRVLACCHNVGAVSTALAPRSIESFAGPSVMPLEPTAAAYSPRPSPAPRTRSVSTRRPAEARRRDVPETPRGSSPRVPGSSRRTCGESLAP